MKLALADRDVYYADPLFVTGQDTAPAARRSGNDITPAVGNETGRGVSRRATQTGSRFGLVKKRLHPPWVTGPLDQRGAVKINQ